MLLITWHMITIMYGLKYAKNILNSDYNRIKCTGTILNLGTDIKTEVLTNLWGQPFSTFGLHVLIEYHQAHTITEQIKN